jgi:hypothetical protein
MGKIILAAIIWPLVTLLLAWWAGTVFSLLWLWYVVPHGIVALTWKQCGVGYLAFKLAKWHAPQNEPEDSRTDSEKIMAALGALAFPWLVLLVGWWLK